MSEKLGTAVLDLKTSNQGLTAGIHQAKTQATGLGKTFGATSIAGVAMGAAVGAALLKAGQALIEFGKESVQMAMEFETSMNSIIALVGVAEQQVSDWADAILDLAPSLRTAPQELADAMFFITSAGLRGETAMDALTVSAQAAASGLGDITKVADAVTSAMNAYGWETVSAEQATDVLVATVREGKLEASELAGVIGRLTPLAAEMGVEFHEVGGILAALTRVGFSAAEASTSLQAIMSELLKPTTEAEAALAAVGMSAAGLRQSIREDGLTTTLQDLYEVLGRDSVALAEVFANTRSLRGVLPLVGTQADTVTGIMDSLAEATGATAQAFEDTADTMEQRMSVATIELQVEMTRLGESIGNMSVPIRALIKGAIADLLGALNRVITGRREALENIDILSQALMGSGTITDFERAIELQQQNVDMSRLALQRTRELRDAQVEMWGAESVYAQAQQTRVNAAFHSLDAQETMYADLVIMLGHMRESEEELVTETENQVAAAEELSDKLQIVARDWRAVARAAESVGQVKGDVGKGDFGTAAVDKFATAALDLTGFSEALTAAYEATGYMAYVIHDATNEMKGSVKRLHSDIVKDWKKAVGEMKDAFVEEVAGVPSAAEQYGEGYGGYGVGFSPLQENPGGIDPGVETAFADALSSAIPELAQLASVAGVLSIMLEGFMSVVGELVSGPIAMLINAVRHVGVFFGTILAPWISVVVDAFMLLAAGAVWFYNNVWRHIGNGMVAVFKSIQWAVSQVTGAIVRVINGIIKLINLIPGINIGLLSNPVSAPDWTTGWLEEIGLGDLTGDAGVGDDGTTDSGVGATFRQQRPIEVTVNVYDNQVFGGSLQQFGLLIRDELLAIDELGL